MPTLNLTKKYEKYPAYKESGAEWIGKIPQDWANVPLRSVAKENEEKNTEGKSQNLLSLSYGKIIQKDINSNEGLLPESFNTYQIVQEDDVVFRLTDLQNDKKSLRVGHVDSEEPGIITSAYLALKIEKELNAKYAYYLLHAYDLMKVFYGMGGGVRQTLDYSNFKYLPVLVPPKEEQIKIANYLDEKTKLIDQIIEKKQKLIAFLHEKRTAVINQAVTKGLDPNVELVESGIDWIGKIPREWGVKKLKSGFHFEKGKEAGKFTQEFIGDEKNMGEYPVYSGQTENNGVLGRTNSYKYDYPEGVLFSTTVGAKAMTTKILVDKFSLSQNCVLMIPNKKANATYYNYLLEIGFKRMRDNIPSHMQPSLRVSDLNKFIVLFPPIEEQVIIGSYLDKAMCVYALAIYHIEQSIELLQEFKSSLISNIVTGRIKI